MNIVTKKNIIIFFAISFLGCTTEEDPALLESVFFGRELSAEELIHPELYAGIDAQFRTSFLDEDFSNNQNGWFQGEDNNRLAVIIEGEYALQVKDQVDVYTLDLPSFDPARNYEIETRFRTLSSSTRIVAAGLAVGYEKDNQGGQRMLFSYADNNEQFRCGKYDSALGGWDATWFGPEKNIAVQSFLNGNKVTIRQYEGILYFFLNEQLLYQQVAELPPGNKYGLLVSEGQIIYFDYLSISYLGLNN